LPNVKQLKTLLNSDISTYIRVSSSYVAHQASEGSFSFAPLVQHTSVCGHNPNLLSTPETLGKWADGCISCRYLAPPFFVVCYAPLPCTTVARLCTETSWIRCSSNSRSPMHALLYTESRRL